MTKYLIDLFCGAGGFSEGAKQAGYKVVIAIDMWEEALKVHKLNHPYTIHLQIELGNNLQATWNIISKYLPILKKNDIIHIHGSPPCQNLSSMNKLKDEKKGLELTYWTLDFFRFCLNKGHINSFTIEQVSNPHLKKYLLEKNKDIFFNVYDMSNYGVPQSRQRIIVSSTQLNLPLKKPKSLDKIINTSKGEMYLINSGCNYKVYRNIFENISSYTITCIPHILCNSKMKKIRVCTEKEMSAIQTFPKTYKFIGTLSEKRRMIANSVPPMFSNILLKTLF